MRFNGWHPRRIGAVTSAITWLIPNGRGKLASRAVTAVYRPPGMPTNQMQTKLRAPVRNEKTRVKANQMFCIREQIQ